MQVADDEGTAHSRRTKPRVKDLRSQVEQACQRQDDDALIALVNHDEDALKHATDEVRKNNEIARAAINFSGAAIWHVHESLRADEAFMRYAVRRNPQMLSAAHARLRDDKNLVLEALATEHGGMAFVYVSERLRDDKEVVLKAVSSESLAFYHVSVRLQKDDEVLRKTAWPGPPDAIARSRLAARLEGGMAPLVIDPHARTRCLNKQQQARRRATEDHRHIVMHEEDYLNGEKRCPSCGSAVKASPDGCSQTVRHSHE